MTTEEMQNVSFPIPVSLRDELLAKMEAQGIETVNQRVINAIKFAFTDNPIPFSDICDNEPKWATREDVQCILEHTSEAKHTIAKELAYIKVNLDRLEDVVNYVCDRMD